MRTCVSPSTKSSRQIGQLWFTLNKVLEGCSLASVVGSSTTTFVTSVALSPPFEKVCKGNASSSDFASTICLCNGRPVAGSRVVAIVSSISARRVRRRLFSSCKRRSWQHMITATIEDGVFWSVNGLVIAKDHCRKPRLCIKVRPTTRSLTERE